MGRAETAGPEPPSYFAGVKQPQRVPVPAPVVTDPRVAVENEELPPELLEVVAGGEAGLAGPDDQGLDVLPGHGAPPSGPQDATPVPGLRPEPVALRAVWLSGSDPLRSAGGW
jgi:hypothetical protein